MSLQRLLNSSLPLFALLFFVNCSTVAVNTLPPPVASHDCEAEQSRTPAGALFCRDKIADDSKDKKTTQSSKIPVYEPLKTYTTEEIKYRFTASIDNYEESAVDGEIEFLRFINYTTYYQKRTKMHGSDIYGFSAYKSWRQADAMLRAIPIGQLDLTVELIQAVHKQASSGLFPILKSLTGSLPSGWIPNEGGVFKKRPNIGKEPLRQPISENAYNALMANSWLGPQRFIEMPSSKPGKRRGMIQYGEPETAPQKLQELIDWYNANKNTMDPIELAATFQHRFTSIHPFIDANGRVSRLLMDRILLENGMPPPILEDPNIDIYKTEAEWAQIVQVGVSKFFDYTKKRFKKHIGPPLRERRDYYPKLSAFLSKKSITTSTGHYTILADGFFYNSRGIPHIYHEGSFYPVADETYSLYMQYGKVDETNPRRRRFNTSRRDLYRAHLGLLLDISENKIDPLNIKTIDYSIIEEANNRGEIYLFEWQRSLITEAVNITSNIPYEILNTGLNATQFEQSQNFEESPSHIIAQYEFADFRLSRLQRYAEKHAPEAVPAILESRRKTHAAARTLLSQGPTCDPF